MSAEAHGPLPTMPLGADVVDYRNFEEMRDESALGLENNCRI